MYELRPSPVHLSADAVRKMPRWLLISLLAAFILPGIAFRDIWTAREGGAFGMMLAMAGEGPAGWLLPPLSDNGPLACWAGALLIRIFGNVFLPETSARLSAVLWFIISTSSAWYGTWFLARRSEAQPVASLFGKTASTRDYGRLAADAATLFFISLFGLVLRLHEPGIESAEPALAALAFFACAWSLNRPYRAGLLAGASCGAMALAASLLAGFCLMLACLLSLAVLPCPGKKTTTIGLFLAGCTLTFGIWPAAAFMLEPDRAPWYFSIWLADQAATVGLPDPGAFAWLAKHSCWYLCPAWPFALWAVARWRHSLRAPHIALPSAFFLAWLFCLPFSSNLGAENLLAAIIVPICVLAAFGMFCIQTRGQLLDFFALSVFSLALAGLWVYWGAWATGFPPKMHRSVVSLAPSADPLSSWPVIAAGLGVTALWFAFAVPRLLRRPLALWYGPWISALGITTLWCTFLALYSGAVDDNRSYRPVAAACADWLAGEGFVRGEDCVQTRDMSYGISSMIGYYSGLDLSAGEGGACRFELVRLTPEKLDGMDTKGIVVRRPHTAERFILRRSAEPE